ncbi:MAG: phosphoglycerate dehydrogenase [Alphaproteobacteria bacterium]|nr:phosphoglycerate dehydrogenase [Alphaproteobacteria bacterium]
MPRVLISDKLSETAVQIFKDRGIEVDYRPGLDADELLSVLGDYDGLAIRSATKVTKEVLDHIAGGKLKVVGRAGIGVDNIDIAAATHHGIVVMNTPHGNAVTTAEHAISMMLASSRMIPQAHASTVAGKWEKSAFVGTEVTGKRLGLVGCGNIGSIVADRAQGLKMKVMVFDPYLSEDKAKTLGVEKLELDDLLAKADYVSLHTPLTDATRNIIDASAIAKMKRGARLINCARGGLVDEVALRGALETGHLAGAAMDVFVEEPARENILFDAPNLVATPHLGASTAEAQEKVALQIADQISDYLLDGAVSNAINMPNVTAEEAPILVPYMELANKLGSILGQVTKTALKTVSVEFEGAASGLNTDPVMAAWLAGLMAPVMASANMVNASSLAQSRGINVSAVRHDRPCDYQSMIRVSISYRAQGGDDVSRTIAGTLVAGSMPRIVEVQGIGVESDFPSNLLYLRNYDKPGFIGDLGSLCGDKGINIATFHLGRRDVGGEAIALVEIDDVPDLEFVDALRGLPQVVRADTLNFG